MGLAENIRYYREKSDMYQSDLGRYLGVSAQAISKWELGKAEPDQDCIVKMCSLFRITADQLFGLEPKQETANAPRTLEARIISGGVDQLPQDERDRILSVLQAMYSNYPDLFDYKKDEGENNET